MYHLHSIAHDCCYTVFDTLGCFYWKIFISSCWNQKQTKFEDLLFLALMAMTKQLWRYYLENSAENCLIGELLGQPFRELGHMNGLKEPDKLLNNIALFLLYTVGTWIIKDLSFLQFAQELIPLSIWWAWIWCSVDLYDYIAGRFFTIKLGKPRTHKNSYYRYVCMYMYTFYVTLIDIYSLCFPFFLHFLENYFIGNSTANS